MGNQVGSDGDLNAWVKGSQEVVRSCKHTSQSSAGRALHVLITDSVVLLYQVEE
jgi:hypothetical protein